MCMYIYIIYVGYQSMTYKPNRIHSSKHCSKTSLLVLVTYSITNSYLIKNTKLQVCNGQQKPHRLNFTHKQLYISTGFNQQSQLQENIKGDRNKSLTIWKPPLCHLYQTWIVLTNSRQKSKGVTNDINDGPVISKTLLAVSQFRAHILRRSRSTKTCLS